METKEQLAKKQHHTGFDLPIDVAEFEEKLEVSVQKVGITALSKVLPFTVKSTNA